MPGPLVVVRFYDNFRFEPVDISGVFESSFGSGTEARTGWFGPETEFEEHKPIVVKYSSMKIRVVASGGTWRLALKLHGTEHESGPIAYNATAAAIAAEFPTWNDPGEPIFELAGVEPVVYAGVSNFIKVIDLGPGEWEIRLIQDSGVVFPAGSTVNGTDIDLGEVIEMQARFDTFSYEVELTEHCGGIGPPPQGKTVPGGARAGARTKPIQVHGRRT